MSMQSKHFNMQSNQPIENSSKFYSITKAQRQYLSRKAADISGPPQATV